MRDLQSDHEAYAQTEVVERCNTGVHVVHLLKDHGESGKHEIHDAVQVGSVNGWCLRRRMRKHHDERQDQALAQNLAESIAGLVFRSHDNVLAHAPHCLADDLCFLREDRRGKCFAKEEECRDLHKDCEDGCREEDPAPTDSLRNIGAADGCDAGSDPGQHAVNGLAFASFLFAPGIGEYAIAELLI